MSELDRRIDELAALMDEYGLERARWSGDEWSVEFDRGAPRPKGLATAILGEPTPTPDAEDDGDHYPAEPPEPLGTPVNSPTTGIYYSSPNPGSPPFVSEGDTVTAGQVIGLIEAMKVFNEITSTVSGRVVKVVATNGQLVNPGDPLILVA